MSSASGYPLLKDEEAGNGTTSNVEYQAMSTSGTYKRRQCGCQWVFLLLGGLCLIASFGAYVVLKVEGEDDIAASMAYTQWQLGNAIGAIAIALATLWVTVEDQGDHLVVAWGPCRCFLCGAGKEKIKYSNIRSYQISKTCWFGVGLLGAVKLFNTCSCCCGEMASLCGQQTVQLTIKERPQALGADDGDNWCCENCCIRCCCGERGFYCGKGCCFQPCCNPCDVNCCAVSTIFISTNDANGLMQLLDQKVGNSNAAVMDGGMATI